MIKTDGKVFIIDTNELSYVFHVHENGLLIHDYFASKITIDNFDISAITKKTTCQLGTATAYDSTNPNFSMDNSYLEFSFPHKGDYKTTPILLKNPSKGYVFDFSFDSFEVKNKVEQLEGLPTPRDGDGELVIRLKEKTIDVYLELHYLVFEEANVIARNVILINNSNEDVEINKLLSYQLDLLNNNYEIINLTGGWATEMHKQIQELKVGLYVHESRTGNSSAKTNPLFVVREKGSSLDAGGTYIFNLIYSGNHIAEVELSTYGIVRIQAGINPFSFNVILKPSETFVTPLGVMTYSSLGINGARKNMHHFVNEHVIRKEWAHRDRPIVVNNWEGTAFKFNERKLMKIAKGAKNVGVELFVLDDGWFSTRNDSSHGLGDYDVNKKKLPHGLNGLSKKIHKLGMKFGLWFEPESINEQSKLYGIHPDWAIKTPDLKPSLGRDQMLLDLTKEEVREYIKKSVSDVLDSAEIEYVKWDMNRNMSDIYHLPNHGEFFHKYILGLYDIMDYLVKRYPDVLFEGCASGGNRFDLGILSYFPQIWASDDTDPIERLSIQSGYYIGYPLSTVSCHVSSSPSQQALRRTDITTRIFAAFNGVFGIELLPAELSKKDRGILKTYIEIYKQKRNTFQFGDIIETSPWGDNKVEWTIVDPNKETAVISHFNILQRLDNKDAKLRTFGLEDEKLYQVSLLEHKTDIRAFGSLVNQVTPFHVNPEGKLVAIIAKFMAIDGEKDCYKVRGNVLNNSALILTPEWSASGLGVRVLRDFGARMYFVDQVKE